MEKICALVLTKNEEIHLRRCLESLEDVVDEIYIVDSFSEDLTTNIAHEFGSHVLPHSWTNYATQFNWGLTQIPKECTWVLRIDADEYLSERLRKEIRNNLPVLDANIDGVVVKRRMKFLGRDIRYGGVFPIKVVRIIRNGAGSCEERWMDEHLTVQGGVISIEGELIDDNRKTLSWWTEKHNSYASREAVDLLNLEFGFIAGGDLATTPLEGQASSKRWVKEKIYSALPGGLRAFLYFFYRYFIRLGFLDGRTGAQFHFLQGFWYRYLVDCKVDEVKNAMQSSNLTAQEAVERVLNISV